MKVWLRAALAVLALSTAFVGVWATAAPHSFYEDFPGVRKHWVSMVGPYNEHLVRDVGTLNLGMAIVLLWALWTLDRRLVVAASVGCLGNALPHLLFHLGHLEHFTAVDAVGQVVTLTVVAVLPLAIVTTVTLEKRDWASSPVPPVTTMSAHRQ